LRRAGRLRHHSPRLRRFRESDRFLGRARRFRRFWGPRRFPPFRFRPGVPPESLRRFRRGFRARFRRFRESDAWFLARCRLVLQHP
jgi:hypothetical protein